MQGGNALQGNYMLELSEVSLVFFGILLVVILLLQISPLTTIKDDQSQTFMQNILHFIMSMFSLILGYYFGGK